MSAVWYNVTETDEVENMQDILMTVLQDMRDLPALINAGADSFLMAAEGMSSTALKKADMQHLKMAADMAAGFGRSISLLVNRLFHEGDLAEAEEFCRAVSGLPFAYAVFQDPGFFLLAEKYGFAERLIYMPDTLVTSREEAQFWKDQNVIPAVSPVLTLEETENIASMGGTMVTVHGHTLLSRSGRPLLSAWKEAFGKEEDVRMTAGLFLQEEKRPDRMPVWEDETGTCIYHDEILTSFAEMEKIGLERGTVWFVNGVYMDRMPLIKAVQGYRRIMDGADGEEEEKRYREEFGSLPLGKGYYYEKTVR